MTYFDDVIMAVDGTIDDIFAEFFSYEPMKEVPNAGFDVDPDRVAVSNVEGVYTDQAMEIPVGQGQGSGPGYVSATPRFSFVTSQIPNPVVRGDVFSRQRDGYRFEVTESFPDGVDRTRVNLTQIGYPQ